MKLDKLPNKMAVQSEIVVVSKVVVILYEKCFQNSRDQSNWSLKPRSFRYKCKVVCGSTDSVQWISSKPLIFEKIVDLYSAKCKSKVRLDGKVAVVTGCNTGIGKETALDLYKRGARVVMACRDLPKAEKALLDIKHQCEKDNNLGSIYVTKLDLNSLSSVRQCAEDILTKEYSIDILVNNAGVMMCPESKTEDNFETQFGVNHLSHFLLTNLLLPKIISSKPSRIVNVSSKAHKYGVIEFNDINFEKHPYNALVAYNQSKLANVLFSRELSNKLKENRIDGVNVYSLHPGVITTELGRHFSKTLLPGVKYILKFIRYFLKTPKQGAQTTIYCAVDEKCSHESGFYYEECSVKKPGKSATDDKAAKELWDVSVKMVGLEGSTIRK